ncbi:MAG: hypothetical protein ABW164_11390 [Sphingobium sp.]
MDFGFGNFLDKFEEHFGRLATRFLLKLVATGIASICVSLVWTHIISPTMDYFVVNYQNYTLSKVFQGVSSPLFTVLLIIVGASVLAADILAWRESWQLRRLKVKLIERDKEYNNIADRLENEMLKAHMLAEKSREMTR